MMGRYQNRRYLQPYTQERGEITRGRILIALVRFWHDNGHAPAMAEIAHRVNLSDNAVGKHIETMRKRGLVTMDYGNGWTLRPTVGKYAG